MKTSINLPVILTNNFLTVISDRELSITASDPRFEQAKKLYKLGKTHELLDLLDRPAAIERYSHGAVKVYDGVITYNGEEIHGVIVDRIQKFLKEGLPFEPLVAFLGRLYNNTSQGVRNKLYSFLEKNHLGITDRGMIVAFKMVQQDGSPPYHGGSFFEIRANKPVSVTKYRVGYEYTYPRKDIREGLDECSSPGLYVGNKSYWGSEFNDKNEYTGSGRLLIVEIDPADVCDVAQSESSKMVTCRFKIVGEYKNLHKAVNKSLVKTSSFGVKPSGQKFHNVRGANGKFVARSA